MPFVVQCICGEGQGKRSKRKEEDKIKCLKKGTN
jgi:hypothetical protein